MAIEPGGKLLHYRLVEKVGEGGMGVVWKAVDSTLDREVAIKLLPATLAADLERLARFEREARLLAALNHTNIATIHGMHEADGVHFLAMEFVDGEDLGERLARGPLDLDATLDVARQIAEALESAHEQGVIHRDLKPANVKLTPGGQIKVLDFGLAKALTPDPVSGDANPSMSPTLTSAGSVAGMILGTAAYMSPEQARGRPADKRADIFSFGCVLYEMLTGKKAFHGDTISDTLASVLKEEPAWSALPAQAGPGLRRVLRRCLEKDPLRRFRDIGDARIDLEECRAETLAPAAARPRSTARPVLAWSIAGLLALALLATLLGRPGDSPQLLRAEIVPPRGNRFNLTGDYAGPPAPSPDGTRIAFVAVGADGQGRLFVRSLDGIDAVALEGTEGASFPFWSPDAKSIGFFAGQTLKRIDLDGSPSITLLDSPQLLGQGKGGSWNRDDVIVFSPQSLSGLFSIPASGGMTTPVTELDTERHSTHRWPHFLADGRHFIYLAADHDDPGGPETGIFVGSLDRGEARLLIRTRAEAQVAAGRILYLQGDTLMAQRLDPDGEPDGAAERLLEEIQVDLTTWKAGFGVADELLAYVPRGSGRGMELQWFGRDGTLLGGFGPPANFQNIDLSPDGRRLAAETQIDSPNGDIWIHDIEQNTQLRVTFTPEDAASPIWTPDGEYVYYTAFRGDRYRIYRKRSSGAGEEELAYESDGHVLPMDWSHDGRYLLIGEMDSPSQTNPIELQALRTGGRATPLGLDPGLRIIKAQFSPDGRFIAYSAGHDRPEIYVVAFVEQDGEPAVRGKWQVSTDGGYGPRWRGDGRELYYVRPDKTVMAVPVSASGDALATGAARPLFRTLQRSDTVAYDVGPDGERFLVSTLGPDAVKPLAVTLHWTRQLGKR